MAHDAFIREQTMEVALGKARYPIEIEIMECCAEDCRYCDSESKQLMPNCNPLQIKRTIARPNSGSPKA